MFGLPAETALLLFGFPVFWLLYTLIFLYVSRDWRDDGGPEDDAR
jgi:hypothetical protein